MPHATEGSQTYRLPVGGMIANCHVVMAAIKASWKARKFNRAKQLTELQLCYPSLADKAVLENLLDGFYTVDEDGSILVDNIAWGRR